MSLTLHDEADLWAAVAATGGLTGPELKAWIEHTRICPDCKKLNDEMAALGRLVRAALDGLSPDAGFEQRILRELDERGVGKGNRWYEIPLFHPALASVGAGLLLAALAGVMPLLHPLKPDVTRTADSGGLSKLPAVVRSAIQQQSQGKTVSRVERSEANGEVSYTVSTNARDASEPDFTVAEDGTLLSLDTTLEATPAAVRKAITTEVGKGRLAGIEKNLDDGEVNYVATIVSSTGQQRDFTFNEDGSLASMEVTPGELPAAVKLAIKAQVGRGLLGGIDKTFDNGETSYVATIISQEGGPRDFTFNEDGTLSSMEVAAAELPPAVEATIRQETGPGRVGNIDKTFDEGETGYEASVVDSGGHRHNFSVAEDGKLISREVALNDTPNAVRQTISRIVKNGKVIEIEQSFDEPNHLVPFQIKGWKDGRPFYFLVSPTGDFLGMED